MLAPKNYMFTMRIPNMLQHFKNSNKEIFRAKISQYGSKMPKIKQLVKPSLLSQGHLHSALNKNKTARKHG